MPALDELIDGLERRPQRRRLPRRDRRAGQGIRRSARRRSTKPQRLSESAGGARIFLKREDLAHTGAHKINNALGQALLAKRMGKQRIIAETGAGQHGVATATACALFGLECIVYMGEVDIARQAPNVFRMKLLGAEVRPVTSGSKTLKDAINEAIRDWVTNVRDTFYIFGTAAGMHPYPLIVRDLQSVIGREARAQMLEQIGALPGCGHRLRRRRLERDRHLPPVRRRRRGRADRRRSRRPRHRIRQARRHARPPDAKASCTARAPTSFRTSAVRSSRRTRSRPGSTIPASVRSTPSQGHRPRHATSAITDEEALEAFQLLCRTEGIIPALESSHAVAYAVKLAPTAAEGRCAAGQSLRAVATRI